MRSLEQPPELVYVGDPMCSWCWGFAPVLEELHERFSIPVRVIVGGLRPGPGAEPVDERMARFLGHHWDQVEARTGQPFNHEILERRGWMYDTELPAVAVVAMRSLLPQETLRFFARIQRAFYAEGLDVTDPASYMALLSSFDVDAERFADLLASEEMKAEAWQDFSEARQLGVSGFPTLLLEDTEGRVLVSAGYAPVEALVPALESWLFRHYGESASGLVCPVGEVS